MKREIDKAGIEAQLKKGNTKKIVSHLRKSLTRDLKVESFDEFFGPMMNPVESPVKKFIEALESNNENIKFDVPAQIMEFNPTLEKYVFRKVKDTDELREAIAKSKANDGFLQKVREAKIQSILNKHLTNLDKTKEDVFGGSGFATDDAGSPQQAQFGPGAFPTKTEYTPLLGTPFYKQLYIYDYLLMHSKAFYFKNYSALAKNLIGNIRNFVIGRGYTLHCDDPKAEEVWRKYEERSNIQMEIRSWVDELTTFGELFVKKVGTPLGLVHRSVDPSTIWEIVTDPENIYDVKYYHQQYNTQYQIYGAKDAPLSKYILRQIPPEQIHHVKINVTSYEKRGRSDLLAALLYFKYFEDHTQFKILRVRNEAAFLWDVTVKGDEGDVQSYLDQTQGISDSPPGSENVHNEAVERKPLAPSFSHVGNDDVMKWIVSYIAMSVNIPVNYLGTFDSGHGSTKAGALVATEPVIRAFDERRTFIEGLLQKIWKDVMLDAGLDPSITCEFIFPEYINEDRSAKIQDITIAHTEGVFSHERMANMIAKELNVTKYDYSDEQDKIKEERMAAGPLAVPDEKPDEPDLTSGDNDNDTKDARAFDRQSARKDNKSL